MADISQAVNQLAFDNSVLNADNDLHPIVVPGLSSDDKGAAFTSRELAKRLRAMLINRNGAVRTNLLTINHNNYTAAVEVPITALGSGKFALRACFAASTATDTGEYDMQILRGSVVIWESLQLRSDESPRSNEQRDPVIVYPFDVPGITSEITYILQFKEFSISDIVSISAGVTWLSKNCKDNISCHFGLIQVRLGRIHRLRVLHNLQDGLMDP